MNNSNNALFIILLMILLGSGDGNGNTCISNNCLTTLAVLSLLGSCGNGCGCGCNT